MVREEIDLYGKKLTIETGRLAKQAHGSALVSLGETTVLVTVVKGGERTGIDFLPLSVEYMERTYSAGRIPGGYFKREGRPTEVEILSSRLIDRPIRPLFPKHMRNEIQVLALVLSADKENDPAIAGIIGASAALGFSPIPFEGPIAGLRVGMVNGDLVVNPTYNERQQAELDIVVAVGPQGLIMVEGEAKEIPEETLVDALLFAQEKARPVLDLQKSLVERLGVQKEEVPPPPLTEDILGRVEGVAWHGIVEALSITTKRERRQALSKLKEEVVASLQEEFPEQEAAITDAVDALARKYLRSLVQEKGRRVDGRGVTDIRPVSCEVGILPRVHGSALFTRGETQVVVSATLGTAADEQKLDLLTGDVYRSFMLHYNFPPFSVGEVKPIRGPSRRDIGHGNLAARALQAVLPQRGPDFPYTIRVVSEVLESNGSSSMATVCGSSMALMDAGVPLRCHVGGIAMGLVKEGEQVVVLTDILGDEDHMGDMDFKVAGTTEGVTAVQMDIKCSGLTRTIFAKALEQAREARLKIIEKMSEAIARPRPEISPYAPKITTLEIKVDRIRDLIGPGGRNIRHVQDVTGATIEVNNTGLVTVAASDEAALEKAVEMVHELTDDAEVGKVYLGQVVKVTEFGAFVRILPGVEGLVHLSELSNHRVRRVEDVVGEGDEILVKCVGIDERTGKIRLSRREAMAEQGMISDEGERQAAKRTESNCGGNKGRKRRRRRRR